MNEFIGAPCKHGLPTSFCDKCRIEQLEAAWQRDQEVIFAQKEEIAAHKQTINQLRQKEKRNG